MYVNEKRFSKLMTALTALMAEYLVRRIADVSAGRMLCDGANGPRRADLAVNAIDAASLLPNNMLTETPITFAIGLGIEVIGRIMYEEDGGNIGILHEARDDLYDRFKHTAIPNAEIGEALERCWSKIVPGGALR